MAKSLVRQQLGDRTFSFVLPADGATAKTFVEANIDGEYAILESVSKSGSDVETKVLDTTVTIKSASEHKVTFSFYAKSTADENSIRAALKAKTFNGVKADDVYIIGMRSIVLA